MKNVLLVFGGKSYEHDISVVTASQIFNRTKIQDVKLIPFYISREGDFFVYESKKFVLSDFAKNKFSEKNSKFKKISFVSGERGVLFTKSLVGLKEYLRVNLAIFACHGSDGENGKLVSVFENAGIYASAGSNTALAICMNKFVFKQTMKGLKIPVVKGFKIDYNSYLQSLDECLKSAEKLGFPVVIKSNNGGSSIGLFVAKTEQEFGEMLSSAFEFDSEILVEKFIDDAREFNVAILGDKNDFEVSEVDEPIKLHDVLSFTDKYLSGGGGQKNGSKKMLGSTNSMASQTRKFPAEIDAKLSEKIKNYASKIFLNLGLFGVVRIDFLFDKNTEKLYVCEVNAIPGSLAFYFFERNNILVNKLTKKLIDVAEENLKSAGSIKQEYFTSILNADSL